MSQFPPLGSQPMYAPPSNQITPLMLQSLRETRPWVLFLGILGFIGCGLMLIVGLVMMVAGAAIGSRSSSPLPVALMGFVYMLFALLYFFPAYFLVKYASAIGRLNSTGFAGHMEEALVNQKSFWRFVGILTLIVICVQLIFLLVAAVGAAAAFSSLRFP